MNDIRKFKMKNIVKIVFPDVDIYSRNYILVIRTSKRLNSKFIINMEGEFSPGLFGMEDGEIVKPTLNDIFEVMKILAENNLMYDANNNKIVKKKTKKLNEHLLF